ncbi:MAG: hypothetical protein V3U84_00695 [Thiotrichaceae bacterium]
MADSAHIGHHQQFAGLGVYVPFGASHPGGSTATVLAEDGDGGRWDCAGVCR